MTPPSIETLKTYTELGSVQMKNQASPHRHSATFRAASASDIGDCKHLILEHGPNQWNHLPQDEVERHLDGIATGETQAVIALDGRRVIGMVTFNVGNFYPEYEPEAERSKPRGYLAEAVVHRAYAGRGVGTALLEQAMAALHLSGINTIYAKRHEENAASAGAMRKAGFKPVATFPDPIRTSGSGKTTVERLRYQMPD